MSVSTVLSIKTEGSNIVIVTSSSSKTGPSPWSSHKTSAVFTSGSLIGGVTKGPNTTGVSPRTNGAVGPNPIAASITTQFVKTASGSSGDTFVTVKLHVAEAPSKTLSSHSFTICTAGL